MTHERLLLQASRWRTSAGRGVSSSREDHDRRRRGTEEGIEARMSQVGRQIEKTTSDHDREQLQL